MNKIRFSTWAWLLLCAKLMGTAQPLWAAQTGAAAAMPSASKPDTMDMGGMDMGTMQGGKPPADARDPDAYSDGAHSGSMTGMDMADDATIAMLLLDKLEYSRQDGVNQTRLDAQATLGGDYNKLWLKTDGGLSGQRLSATRVEALWNHAVAAYWGTQLGVRHDFGEGPGRNWLAAGVQGLAPYWFDVEATAYLGERGRIAARVELEYELLLSQRLVLQPNLEFNIYGRADPQRQLGAGFSDVDFGLRLRYEITRQFAPYIGVVWERKLGETAALAHAVGADQQEIHWVGGFRLWF
jgi:copper resistance protein B